MERYLEGEELDAHDVAAALKLGVTRGEVFPVGCCGRDEEPRHACAARPARRGRAVAGEAGRAVRGRGRVDRGVRLQDGRRPVRGQDQPLPRAEGRGHDRDDAASTTASTRRSAWARCSQLQGRTTTPVREFGEGDLGAVAKLKDVQTGDLLTDREVDGRAAGVRLPGAGDELRRDAEDQGRGGEGRLGDQAPRRGGSDAPAAPRPADRRGDPRRDEPDARRGRARAREAALRRRRRAPPAARPVPRDDPLGVAGAPPLQEADRRARAVRRLRDRARADRGARGLRVRRQDRRRRDPAELSAPRWTRGSRRRCSTASSPARRSRACASSSSTASTTTSTRRRWRSRSPARWRSRRPTRRPTPCCSSRSWSSR